MCGERIGSESAQGREGERGRGIEGERQAEAVQRRGVPWTRSVAEGDI